MRGDSGDLCEREKFKVPTKTPFSGKTPALGRTAPELTSVWLTVASALANGSGSHHSRTTGDQVEPTGVRSARGESKQILPEGPNNLIIPAPQSKQKWRAQSVHCQWPRSFVKLIQEVGSQATRTMPSDKQEGSPFTPACHREAHLKY